MTSEGEKTEVATAKKRLEAAKRGDRLASRDLAAAATVAGFLVWIGLMGGTMLAQSARVVESGLRLTPDAVRDFQPGRSAAVLVQLLTAPLVTLAFALTAAAIIPSVALGGGFRPGALAPKLSRLDPVAGLKRLLGGEALVGLVFALLKVVAGAGMIAWYGYRTQGDIATLAVAANATVPASALLGSLLRYIGLLMLLAGTIDLFVQWQRREMRLRMTKQEVREEHKSAEGAPERKRAQRERQYAIAARSARKAMTEATVVLTNPTHFAIALRYRPGVDGVPVVVARGQDGAAHAIRDLAQENAVPLFESPVLARALYFTSKVGDPVVHHLYLAVATVLAILFDLDSRIVRQRRAADENVPDSMRFGADGKLA